MPAALRAELTGLKPRALLKRAEAMGVNEDALDEGRRRQTELSSPTIAAPPSPLFDATARRTGLPRVERQGDVAAHRRANSAVRLALVSSARRDAAQL